MYNIELDALLKMANAITARGRDRNGKKKLQRAFHFVVNRKHNYNEKSTRCKCNNNCDEDCASLWIY